MFPLPATGTTSRLMTSHELPLGSVADLVARALHEDLAGGDLTTEACIDADAMARASAVARGAMVACGGPVFEQVFRAIDPSLVVERVAAEGERVGVETIVEKRGVSIAVSAITPA